jgi:hypothetical protein
MRQMRFAGIVITGCVLMLCAFAVAGQNPMGVANRYEVSFAEKVWIADTMLPQGDYEIRHVMEGQDHIMIFRQLKVRKPAEVRAKCTMVPLLVKAPDTQKVYTLNAANERVLHELIFKGDLARHVF